MNGAARELIHSCVQKLCPPRKQWPGQRIIERPRKGRKQHEPVILDIEILGGDGGIDGVVEALGGRQLAVVLARPGAAARVRVDDGLVYVAARVRPRRRRRGRRAPAAHQRTAVVLAVQAQDVAAACRVLGRELRA